jgi:zinc protease
VFIIVGNVQREPLLKKIEGLFAQWRPGEAGSDDFVAPPARSSRSAYLVDRPGSAQSNIIIANGGITRTSPDYFPMLLMHTVLGANASSRLFMNLREEKGYTYGAYSSLDARRTAGTFRATAEVRTPVTGDSLKEFFYELNRIRTEPVSEKEIADAKSYLTGVFPIRLETQEGLIDQLVQIKMFRLADDYLQRYRDRVQAVTVAQIQGAASKYVTPDEAAIVVVGDGRQILHQVEPYATDIEFYNTAGKRKDKPLAASASGGDVTSVNIAGSWVLNIETPLGQDIPATLILLQSAAGLGGRFESEMGGAELVSATFNGRSFAATMSIEMDGHAVEAQLSGEIDMENIEGSISLQSGPPLVFTGVKSD